GRVGSARILHAEEVKVLAYTTEDLVVAEKLLHAGCEVLMPWGAPIGTARGLSNEYGLRTLRSRFETIPVIIDAGLGLPSHAARAMEIGYDAVLLNTAVARAEDPARMAEAFAEGIRAGRSAYLAGPMQPSDMPQTSTSLANKADLRE
ncbi:MAG: thiazole synthase, partial [Gammaproteobacteria bacterium]|nr:thiazole synthase [Gammaproteobacteria bacterium]